MEERNADRSQSKLKSYARPKLVGYGSVSKLTEGNGSGGYDMDGLPKNDPMPSTSGGSSVPHFPN